MKTKHVSLLFAGILALCTTAQAGVVTLTARSTAETYGVSELNVGPYEVAEVITFKRTGSATAFYVQKDGNSFTYTDNFQTPVVVAGPATIRLVASGLVGPPHDGEKGMCTIRVSPEAFPPDRTMLVSPGTNQTRVTLECSTNLVNWFAATNGVYGPMPEAKFFRIKAEPAQ